MLVASVLSPNKGRNMQSKITKHLSGPYQGLWVAEELPSGNVLAVADTHASVWRKLDWINAEADNPQQAKGDWAFNKAANNE